MRVAGTAAFLYAAALSFATLTATGCLAASADPATPAPAAAPPAVPAAPGAPAPAVYEVKGFRSAVFGMSRDEVVKSIQQDFGVPADKIVSGENKIERTTSVALSVDHLDPGPGPAMITFIFGATKKQLIHVNVAWLLQGEPAEADRRNLLAAGVQLAHYFQGYGWANNRAIMGMPVGPNSLVLFAATDQKGGGVEVRVDGVSFERIGADGKRETSPVPKGPAGLRVSYAQNASAPDVYKIEPGKF